MFNRVLIATDLSPSSFATLECAKSLYLLGTRECVLANCFLIREQVAFPEQVESHVVSALDEQKALLEKVGIRTTVVAEVGLPGSHIPCMAVKQNCSLIVVGSHGHNLAGEILLGGTATEILHQARTPVLIIHLAADRNTGQPVFQERRKDLQRHILYATDFSDHSAQAFKYVRKCVECGALHVTLLHVQDKSRLGGHLSGRLEEFNKIDQQRLAALKSQLEAVGSARIDIEVPYGAPTAEIVKRINETDVSIVIMGSHGRGFISEMFLGSVSHNIARHSQAPVLLVPGQLQDIDITKESCTQQTI